MRIITFIFVLALGCFSVRAQVTTLRGTVTDENGAVVAGAHITVRDGQNVIFETTSDDVGAFKANIQKKRISVEVKATGFLTYTIDDFRVPEALVVDIPSIVLKLNKDLTTEEFLVLEDPVEAGNPSLPTEISARPIPAPSFSELKSQSEKQNKSGRSTFCADLRDDFGGLIHHVKVKLEPTRLSSARQTYTFFTDNDGNLRTEILNGIYKITFSKESFKSYVVKEIAWPPSATECLSVTLKSAVPPHQIT